MRTYRLKCCCMLLYAALFCSCGLKKDRQLEHALEYAGENAPELLKVLSHYGDST
ncbi:MAG: hypothetical protein K2I16_07040 [Muribaculaceae bacterium]|nr:hypothetical protein [Muribaculaceae bacterium]